MVFHWSCRTEVKFHGYCYLVFWDDAVLEFCFPLQGYRKSSIHKKDIMYSLAI